MTRFQAFMDYHSIINGIDMSNALFILLSNTGGREITQKTFEFWQQGRIRNDLRYADYERLTLKGKAELVVEQSVKISF